MLNMVHGPSTNTDTKPCAPQLIISPVMLRLWGKGG